MSVNHTILWYSNGGATSCKQMELRETFALLATEGAKPHVLVDKHNRIAKNSINTIQRCVSAPSGGLKESSGAKFHRYELTKPHI